MDVMEIMDSEPTPRAYKCSWIGCSKAFNRKSDLQRHERIHRNHRPFECHYEGCGKCFIQRSALTVHIRTHTGEKPHQCDADGCGKRFADSSSLARHRRIHTGKRPYSCGHDGCTKSFCRKNAMVKHQRTTHQHGIHQSMDTVALPHEAPDELRPNVMSRAPPAPQAFFHPMEHQYILHSQPYHPHGFGPMANENSLMATPYSETPRGIEVPARLGLDIPSYHPSPASIQSPMQISPVPYSALSAARLAFDPNRYYAQPHSASTTPYSVQGSPVVEPQPQQHAHQHMQQQHQQTMSSYTQSMPPPPHTASTAYLVQESPIVEQQPQQPQQQQPQQQQQQQQQQMMHPYTQQIQAPAPAPPPPMDHHFPDPSPPQSVSPEPQAAPPVPSLKMEPTAGGPVPVAMATPYHHFHHAHKHGWLPTAAPPSVKPDWAAGYHAMAPAAHAVAFPGAWTDAKIYSAGSHLPLPSSRLDDLE